MNTAVGGRLGFVAVVLGCWGCVGTEARPDGAANAPVLHLADRLDTASAVCGRAAERAERSWSFDAPQPEWQPLSTERIPPYASVRLEPLGDGIRVALGRPRQQRGLMFIGGLIIDLSGAGLRVEDWDTVLVRARSRDRLAGITAAHNIEEEPALPHDETFFAANDIALPVFNDGSQQTYAIPLRARAGTSGADPTLRNLAVLAAAPGSATIDILSVRLVPRGAGFGEDCGTRAVTRGGVTRHTLFAHAPATITYSVTVPAGGRLDLALAVQAAETIDYTLGVGGSGGETKTLLQERVEDSGAWLQRSVDLSPWGGQTVDLVLAAKSSREGAVALWGAPIVAANAGTGVQARPNIVFYVIDGGGADFMSVYGYNRLTTPFLERLAAEAVVFERAYSNATWTQPSTASFMTSLQHSVLGGLRRGVHSTPVPAAATPMAERLQRGGYQTASFTTNPNAARTIGLERGVDVMIDTDTDHHSTSSSELHERFWRWRHDYPGAPYWVHFQTTDVHEPNEPVAPFAGLYVTREEKAQLGAWDNLLWQTGAPSFGTTSISGWYHQAIEQAKIDRVSYFNLRRGLYDETMAYQDRQLGAFVERLKAEGEWDNTLFIVAADHGHPAGTFARFGRGMFAEQPEPWQGALFDAYATRVPLIVSWPGRIPGGRRVTAPVSMIDILPTILDLVGLPPADVAQGQSLAPLLRGTEPSMTVHPVILDEFRVDERTGAMVGNIEIVDGRWGASLEIGPGPGAEAESWTEPEKGRHAIPAGGRWGAVHPFFAEAPRLLLYDLAADPFALKAVNDQHPELVEKYRRLLAQQWKAHQALATRFSAAEEAPLTSEQLLQLRALGYIQ